MSRPENIKETIHIMLGNRCIQCGDGNNLLLTWCQHVLIRDLSKHVKIRRSILDGKKQYSLVCVNCYNTQIRNQKINPSKDFAEDLIGKVEVKERPKSERALDNLMEKLGL